MKTVVAMQANCGQVGLKLYKTMSICFRKSCVADDIKGQANTMPCGTTERFVDSRVYRTALS